MADSTTRRVRRKRGGSETKGADFMVEESKYGNREVRRDWQKKVDDIKLLHDAVHALQDLRDAHRGDGLTDVDDLWMEALLEEKVAVLRFVAMSNSQVRTRTLGGIGKDAQKVCDDFLARADSASDYFELERINEEFRHTYKPPMMPTNFFMRTEVLLAEKIMKVRSLNWFDKSIETLRSERGVVVHKAEASSAAS
ncbi:methane monooxygenase (plasmid) [Rhodococcus sp. ZPP]|nr:methane monooxygenase [Rhodococcus erythropolis]QTJ71012.1 methane monooxygenase [Rhodococcus sp. ZPP]